MAVLINQNLALMFREMVLNPVSPCFEVSAVRTDNNLALGCAFCLDRQENTGNPELPHAMEYIWPVWCIL